MRTPSRSTAGRSSDAHTGPSQNRTTTIDPSALMHMHTPTLAAVPEASESASSIGGTGGGTGAPMLNGRPQRTVSSTEVGMQLGMSAPAQLPPDTPGAPIKRTMYGTELDGDTRFGDFGIEGVASGFWAGLGRRT